MTCLLIYLAAASCVSFGVSPPVAVLVPELEPLLMLLLLLLVLVLLLVLNNALIVASWAIVGHFLTYDWIRCLAPFSLRHPTTSCTDTINTRKTTRHFTECFDCMVGGDVEIVCLKLRAREFEDLLVSLSAVVSLLLESLLCCLLDCLDWWLGTFHSIYI